MSEDQRRPTLTVPQHALSAYVNSLLREAPPAVEVSAEPEEAVPEQAMAAESSPGVAVVTAESASPVTVEAPAHAGDEAAAAGIFLPTEAFQALFLRVGKLNLAVPLVKLNGILKSADVRITRLPGQAPWHLGLIREHGITTHLVDSARLLLPQEYLGAAAGEGEYPYFILIDGKCWALGCHSLADVTVLKPAEVKWRHARTVRPWLAGTVIEKTCAILDIDGLIRTLRREAATS